MPSMDEYERSGGYVRDAALSGNTSNFTFNPVYSGGASSGYVKQPTATEKTTHTSYVITTPEAHAEATQAAAQQNPLAKMGISSTSDMMSIALFGGLIILVMSLFKG